MIKEKFRVIKDFLGIHRQKVVLVLSLMIGFAGTFYFSGTQSRATDLQQGIADEIIRFHVLANSDSEEDQELKLQVKTHIVDYMQEMLQDAEDIEETREIIKENVNELKEEARQIIREKGYNYGVTVELTEAYFPVKTYGDLTFPAGDYEALQIKIGQAEGKNWWCVLYPNLCFIDVTHAVFLEESQEELKNILTEEEYESIVSNPDIRIRSKYMDMFLDIE